MNIYQSFLTCIAHRFSGLPNEALADNKQAHPICRVIPLGNCFCLSAIPAARLKGRSRMRFELFLSTVPNYYKDKAFEVISRDGFAQRRYHSLPPSLRPVRLMIDNNRRDNDILCLPDSEKSSWGIARVQTTELRPMNPGDQHCYSILG